MEKMKEELVTEEGFDGVKWERMMQADVRPKIQAALMLVEKSERLYSCYFCNLTDIWIWLEEHN